jgi:signal transduction protein with GAF and PtsI domain
MIKSLSLGKLEWAGIIGPVGALVVYHYLIRGPAHGLFHSIPGIIVLSLLVGLAIVVFSRSMFRAINRYQRDLEDMSAVVASQNAQLRALNDANLALSEERLVSSVLQRTVDLSRELVDARYAALSIIGENGGISTFLTSGMVEAEREKIGKPPSGEGLLGLMLHQTGPLRLDDMKTHSASVGFPSGHPAMKSFLGVPIAYNGRVVGSLYLVDKTSLEPFTVQDEEIVTLFSNQAAVAIQNADLYEQIQALAVGRRRTHPYFARNA